MKKIKRWMSALLALCMLTVALPVPVLAETTGMPAEGAIGAPISEPTAAPTAVTTGAAAEEQTDASPQQTDDPEAAVATAVPTPVPTDEVTGTPTPVPTDEATATPTPVPTDEATGTPAPVPTDNSTGTPTPVPTDETTGTPTPVPTDEAMGTPTPVPTDETAGTPTPVPTDEATGTPTPVPADEATGTPTPVPTDETAGTPTPVPTDEATGTPTPLPTDAAEVKTIASFEAVAPEGLFVPQGTFETDLGLPASLNAQFSDGAAGEVAVAWQCAAGYDPSAEAGTQFAFAAVLPEGCALAEGVSLPQILVTLTPPLANAMLMAQASGTDWTLSDGKLTVKGIATSDDIPSFASNVKSIEVAGSANFILARNVSFSGSIKVLAYGSFYNEGNLSGNINIESGGTFDNYDTISGGTITGSVRNLGTITGGTFTGQVDNYNRGTITGGDFTAATVVYYLGTVTGGVFNGFTMDSKTNTLTITGDIDLSTGSLAPLTIALDEVSKIVVNSGASFNAGNNAVTAAVECNGTITGGTFKGAITGTGTLEGGDFTEATVENFDGSITGGTFSKIALDRGSGELTITGDVDLSNGSLAPLTIGVTDPSIKSITIEAGATFNAGDAPVSVPVTNNGTITDSVISGSVTNNGTISGSVIPGSVTNNATGTIKDGTFIGSVTNSGTIQKGRFESTVTNTGTIADGTFNWQVILNGGEIKGGTFEGAVFCDDGDPVISGGTFSAEVQINSSGCTITSGNFTGAEVTNDGTIEDGTFSDGTTVKNGGYITGGDFTGATVTNNDTIKGGTFTGAEVTNSHEISGGTFSDGTTVENRGTIKGGDFKNATVTNEEDGIVSGGEFDNFKLESGKLTITGTVDLSAGEDALAPLTIGLDAENIQSITVAESATFNAGSTPVADPVTCNGTISGGTFAEILYLENHGKITGGTFKGAITGAGELAGGDFSGADLSRFNGTITGGTFAGYTIRVEELTGRILTITAEDFDLTKIDLASLRLNRVVVAESASVSNADVKDLSGVAFVNNGEISGGTFAGIVYLQNSGTITGGTFNAYLMNLASVTGATINGTIDNYGTITGCTFGDSASVQTNRGTIEVTMTVNGADATFEHGAYILASLTAQFGEGDWYAVAGEEQAEISEDARFGLQKQAYACAHYTKDNALYISAPTSVTEEMLAGVEDVIVTATGEITGGTFTNSSIYMKVEAGGKISGGTFACDVSNDGAISGGTFEGAVRSEGAISGGTFEGEVYNNKGGTISKGTFKGIVHNHEGCTISGGTFEGEVYNNDGGTITEGIFTDIVNNKGGEITGGTFTGATVNNEGGTITGGVFDDFTMDSQSKELTITGVVDLDAEGALAPLTIALDGESIWGITVATAGTFDAGSTPLSVSVTNEGEITGGTFSSRVENSGTITGGTFSSTVTNNAGGTISGSITIAAYGKLNNNAGGTISGEIMIAAYGNLNNEAGGTISGGTFTVFDDGGMANWGTITGPATFEISEYAGLLNRGAISGGSFTGEVTNHDEGKITGGTFNSGSFVGNSGIISGGTFSGAEVLNAASTPGKITGGTFNNGTVVNNRGSIADGDFRGATVNNLEDTATVTGGTFDKFTVATDEDGERTITITGAIDMDSADALHPLTIGLDDVGSVTIAAGGSFDAGNTTVSAHVFNYGGIGGGTFREGTVYNRDGGVISAGTFGATVYNQGSKIAGGTFNATVNNTEGGEISGGTFGSGVYNMSSITGAITLTSEQALINYGGDISGNITFTKEATLNNDGGTISGNITFTEGGYLANSGKITGGTFSGTTVTNRSGGIIFDGTFTDATVTNDGIIAYGDFRAAEVTNRDGSITGGIFKNCTLKDGELTITQNVDLREDADALAPLSLAEDPFAKLEIASGCAFNAGDNTVSVYVINNGTINGGTFENSLLDNYGTISGGTFNSKDVFNNPGGTISGGAFSGRTSNEGAITGGTFGYLYQNARVQGVDGSVPTLNGPIENGRGSILQPCNFGANASVVENRGVIEVPATVNNIPQSLRYGEKTLEQLKGINANDVWFEQAADGTQARVAESATVGLDRRAYVSKDLPRVSAPAAKIDFDGEAVTVSLDATFALPQGLQRGELDVVFTYGDKSGRIEGAFANGNSATVSLSDLGEALGLALPAANGSGDAKLRVALTAAGQEDSYNWGVAELTVPERPAAADPGAEKRAHELTDRSIQMLDAGMLAEYDFGVAVQADALPAEPALVDEDGDGLITGLAGDTEYCLYFRKKATDGAFRSAWFRSAEISARTNRSIPLAAGVETAEYTWTPDFELNIEDAIVFARVEGGGEQAIPENAFALTITGENGAAVTGTIRDAGTYTVKVALDCDNYVLAAGGDSFTITVRPLDLSGEEVVLSVEGPLTVGYTGASVYPQIDGNMLEVELNGKYCGALPADCFTIAAAEGKNDVNAGDAYLTIVGQGNASGEAELAYTITAKSIADESVNVEPIPGQIYTGSALEPSVTVKDGEKALVKDVDYAATYANNTAVGTATVTITGKGNYTGTRTANFAIAPKDIAAASVTVEPIGELVYTGSALEPAVTIRDGAWTLSAGEDYELAYAGNVNAGEATIAITGKGNYTGERTVNFTIVGKGVADFTIDPIPDQVYTGAPVTPEVTVRDGGHVLTDDECTVRYENNLNAGAATVTITGKGNYTGELKANFTIAAKDIAAETFAVAAIADQVYTGAAITPPVTLSDGGRALTAGTDYQAAYAANVDVGTANVTLKGVGNYTGTRTATFAIVQKDIAEDEGFTIDPIPDQVYTGGEIEPEIVVKDGDTVLVEGEDYEVSFGENTDAGTVTVTITGTGNYSGGTEVTFEIVGKDIDEDEGFTIDPIPDQVYTGGEIEPEIVVKDGDTVLVEGEDYEVTYEENADAGEATVTITGKGNYTGETEVTFEIVEKDITEDEGFTIDPIPEQTYTGEEIKPEIVVKDGDKVLVEGKDYEVTYEENTDAGEATVTITGKGNYTGEMQATFQIVKAAAPAIQWPEVTGSITYGQTVAEIVLSAMEDANGAFAWKCPDYAPDAGAQLFPLVYTPNDTDNYDYTGVPMICEVCVEVAPKDISGMTVDAIPAQMETGKALTPAVTVRDGDTVLTAGADYTVAYANNIKPGTATATITGVGNYAGMLTATFTIREAEKDDEDENDESTVETLTPAQQAENLTAGEAVDGIVTDRNGETMPYVPSTGEVTDEETQEVLQRTLVIAAEPLLDEDGQPVLRDGQPVYEQRNLNLSRGLLDALTELGYTHIRFTLGDAALEWQIAEMTEDGYVVRLAPMEADELSPAEEEAIGDAEALTGSYRARITAMIEGEEADVTNALPSLTAIFDAASVRELTEGETPQLLLVPNDGEPEVQVLTTQYIEATDTEKARYEALLMESGLFVMILQ